MPTDEIAVACDPNAVQPADRERWIQIGMEVYGMVEEVKELSDGWACRLPGDAATLLKAAEYVSLDRQCCSFVRWSLIVEPGGGPLWLHITGPEGTRESTRETFETTTMLREEVARAAGLDISRRAVWVHPADPQISTASITVR